MLTLRFGGCFHGCLLLPLRKLQPALLKLAVGIVADDEMLFFVIQMALQKQALLCHFQQFFPDEFLRFSHGPCQLFQGTVGLLAQKLFVLFEPADAV